MSDVHPHAHKSPTGHVKDAPLPSPSDRDTNTMHKDTSFAQSMVSLDFESLSINTSEKRSLDTFHLQFANSDCSDDFSDDVDRFIKKICPGQAPLQYADHRVVQRNGKSVAQVRFQLTPAAQRHQLTLDVVGKQFCQLIFAPTSRRWLSLVTTEAIIGISAGPAWNHWFSRGFFTASIHQGSPLLQEISETFRADYAPNWILALGFAVVAGLNFSSFVDGDVSAEAVTELFEAGAVFAFSILERFATSKSCEPSAELQKKWKQEHTRFKTGMTVLSRAFARYHESLGSIPLDSSRVSPEVEVCDALYEMTESAALALTCNRDILIAWKEAHSKAKQDLALGSASLGLSLWAGYSAFWTVTTVSASQSILPLAAWGIGDVIGLALFAEIPVLTTVTTTTTLWWCPPVAVAATIGAAAFGIAAWKKNQKRKKYNRRIQYHEAMKNFIGAAYGLGLDTQKFLQWVHCTDLAQPTTVDFVNDDARQRWQALITSVRAATGQTPTSNEFSPQFVGVYLDMQRRTLDRLQQAVRDAEAKLES